MLSECHIKVAVAIEVGNCEVGLLKYPGRLWRRKGPIAVPEHDAAVASRVHEHQIRFSVVIQVCDFDFHGLEAGKESLLRLKSSVAVAQKHADVIAKVVGRDHIRLAVPV